eukprot:jgi/Botrbrau1/21568/Bobra.174_2s0066.1
MPGYVELLCSTCSSPPLMLEGVDVVTDCADNLSCMPSLPQDRSLVQTCAHVFAYAFAHAVQACHNVINPTPLKEDDRHDSNPKLFKNSLAELVGFQKTLKIQSFLKNFVERPWPHWIISWFANYSRAHDMKRSLPQQRWTMPFQLSYTLYSSRHGIKQVSGTLCDGIFT